MVMRVCHRKRWTISQFFLLPEWEQLQWFEHDRAHMKRLQEAMDTVRNDKGEIYAEMWLSIYLQMLG